MEYDKYDLQEYVEENMMDAVIEWIGDQEFQYNISKTCTFNDSSQFILDEWFSRSIKTEELLKRLHNIKEQAIERYAFENAEEIIEILEDIRLEGMKPHLNKDDF